MSHVVLLGDSIFDNARYVPGHPAVIDQLRRGLPAGWKATLLAIDGSCMEHVPEQMRKLPSDATHLVVSIGGNDALMESPMLNDRCSSVGEAMAAMHTVRERFRSTYRDMLTVVLAAGRPTAACTVYDKIPGLSPSDSGALAGFNEVILAEAIRAALPIVDLRLVCGHAADYSSLSPIEPSMAGGAKITRVIADLVTTHDFACGRSIVYT